LRPDSVGPTYTKGQWKGIHGTVRSSAGGKLTAKTMEGARNEIRLGVFYLNDILFDVEVQDAPYADEFDDWEEELGKVKKLKSRTEAEKRRQWHLEDLCKLEKKRQEGQQTVNVIQAIVKGMEVSLLYYMSVLIVLELVG